MNNSPQVILKSELEPSQVLKKISSVTAPDFRSLRNGQHFVGTVSENSFCVQLMIHYSGNDRVRPEILGEVSDVAGGSEIHLSINLPKGWKTMGILILIFNILAIGIIAFIPGVPEILASKWWVPILFLVLFGGILYATFRARSYESIQILKKLVEA